MPNSIKISIAVSDALQFRADVLALKYAQELYGVDLAVHKHLERSGVQAPLPMRSSITYHETCGAISSSYVLFVGVKTLYEFGYTEIREFARQVLAFLALQAPKTRRVALTLHGTGYGLDEIEAFESELAGVIDAVSARDFPENLKEITFVEKLPDRARRLSVSLKKLLPDGVLRTNGRTSIAILEDHAQATLRTAGYRSAAKSHVFVAMPFAEEMHDIFHYGIQGAVNAEGLLCERADLSAFTGDVLDWVKRRISTAKLVVADLSLANPNVYLEVGYAWGCQVPTVLLARDPSDMKFDVRSQKCILYKSIKHLEESLRRELQGLSV